MSRERQRLVATKLTEKVIYTVLSVSESKGKFFNKHK